MDYFATGKLNKATIIEVLNGIAAGCKLSGCALIGGETAEMPGHYKKNDFDIAGFCVGAVERESLLNNAIIGASKGYEKTLELVGVGYRAALKGKQLNLQLGFSHDVNYDIPENIKISVEKQTILKISGPDKQQVGTVASEIRSFRPPEPYKGKGIKEKGQYILRKEGKKK